MNLAHAFVDFFYPPLCLHCNTTLEKGSKIFCRTCLSALEMLDPQERCSHCFAFEDFISSSRICSKCRQGGLLFDRLAAVFDFEGPAATLVRQMKYGDQPYLAKGAAAWMTRQFLNLEWPFPDALVPVPMPWVRKIERGYNQSALLAEELSILIKRPCLDILQRKSGEYSQAGLNKKQRLAFEGSTISCRPVQDVRGKTLLVIDDVLTTGSTLRKCAEALIAQQPKRLYALVLCRAL